MNDVFEGLRDLAKYAQKLFGAVAPDAHKEILTGIPGEGDGHAEAIKPTLKRSEMTPAQKVAYIEAHGGEAYLSLPQ